jgi:hypothetical protein
MINITSIDAIAAAEVIRGVAEAATAAATAAAIKAATTIAATTSAGKGVSFAESPIAGQPAIVTKNGRTRKENGELLLKPTELTMISQYSYKDTKVTKTMNTTNSMRFSDLPPSMTTTTTMKPRLLQSPNTIPNTIQHTATSMITPPLRTSTIRPFFMGL